MDNYKSGIMVFLEDRCVHYVLYENDDASELIEELKEELCTDEEFGLTEIGDRLEFFIMSPEQVQIGIEELKRLESENSSKLH